MEYDWALEYLQAKSSGNLDCGFYLVTDSGFRLGMDECNPHVDDNPVPDFTWITNTVDSMASKS